MRIQFLTLLICTLINQTIFSQDDAEILKSFERRVRHLDSIFSKNPIVEASQNWVESSTGKINYLVKIEKIAISYDVQKTNSLVAPYTGFVTLTIKLYTNQKSGDIKGYKEMVGFADPEKAKQSVTFSPCCSDEYNSDEWCKGDIKATYLYQNGIWVLKAVEPAEVNRIKNGTSRGDISRGILNKLFE
jgi:hypothetical protein